MSEDAVGPEIVRELKQLNIGMVVIGALVAALVVIGWTALGYLAATGEAQPIGAPIAAAPGPTTEASAMADWIVSGAGEDCDGEYQRAGTYNDQDYYVGPSPDDDWYLFFGPGFWGLAQTLGAESPSYYEQTGSLPGNPWQLGTGASPAPTLAAGEEDIHGGLSLARGVKITLASETTPAAIRATLRTLSGTGQARAAIYNSDEELVAETEEVAVGTGEGWHTMAFASPPTLAAGDYYLLVRGSSSAVEVVGDEGGAYCDQLQIDWEEDWADPATITADATADWRVELATAAVLGDLAGGYGVTGALAGDLAAAYAATCAVAGSLTGAYAAECPLGGCLRSSYAVETPLSGSVSGAYAVTRAASGQARGSYAVLGRVQGDHQASYTVEGGGGLGVLTLMFAHYESEGQIIS